MRPTLPRLLCAAAAMTAQPRTLPHPFSFVQQRRRQLSRAPCPAPSPSCGDDDDSSAVHPTPPRLLRAAAATTAQPRALPRPVSFVQRRRRQLSRVPYPARSPSCSSGDDSSAAHPAPPRLLCVATTMTAQPRALSRPVSFMWRRRRQLSRAPCPAPSPSCSGGDDSSAARPAPPRLLRAAAATTAQPRALPRPVSF